MSYTVKNFKSGAELKRALKAGEEIRCFQHGLGPDLSNYTGTVNLEGPHFPKPHRWYLRGWMENGILIKILKD